MQMIESAPLEQSRLERSPLPTFPVSVSIFYLASWNVDYSIFFGEAIGGLFVSIARWIAIAAVFCSFSVLIKSKRNYNTILLSFVLAPAVICSQDLRFSTIAFVRILSVLLLYEIIKANTGSYRLIANGLGVFVSVFVLASLPLISFETIQNTLDLLAGNDNVRLRSAGISINPNDFGVIPVIAIYFWGAPFLKGGRNFVSTLVRAVMILASVVCCLASGSRSSLLAMSLALSACALIRIPLELGSFSFNNISVLRKLGLVIIFLISSVPLFLTLDRTEVVSDRPDVFSNSNEERLDLWKQSLKDFSENPTVGIGLGMPFDLGYSEQDEKESGAPFAHNALLNYLRDCGIFGIVFLFFILRESVHVGLAPFVRKRTDQALGLRPSEFFLVGSMVAVLIFSVVDGGLQSSYGINAIFAIALGALSSAHSESSYGS